MKGKICALILPYFGQFNSYFQLFLNSVSMCQSYDLLLFTDNPCDYDIPDNVRIFPTTLENIKGIAESKFGFPITLTRPYKLCDIKPMYGFIFEEYIQEYKFWGHCDCDLIFGNLDKLLNDILSKPYDKYFAAGHLTIYRNTQENNRVFMHSVSMPQYYKNVLSTDEIVVFDEDFKGSYNVHDIFKENKRRIYSLDLSLNVTQSHGTFVRSYYDESTGKFKHESYQPARYYWDSGNIRQLAWNDANNDVDKREFIYLHLQGRKMRGAAKCNDASLYEIMPDRFRLANNLPNSKHDMKMLSIKCSYLYWFDVYMKRLKNKINRILR